jgi:Protein of unknown function (DUF664)
MTAHDPKTNLKEYLQGGRDTLLWKLNGLSEYDVRRPLVPTGTNLLGLVKHKAHSEFVYFGDTFERPSGEPVTWFQSAEPNADMWATADESLREIVELYQRAWAHSDTTIDTLTLESIGHVPHWPAGQNEVTLHEVLVHVIVDTQRHAGHADIIRELIDGAVGLLEGNSNLPPADQRWWASYRDRLQRVAQEASQD